jgi:hypothetical protein
MAVLTKAQQAFYDRLVNEKGGRGVYNGRARTRIEALVAAGLVTADWDLDISDDSSSRWHITVTAVLPEGSCLGGGVYDETGNPASEPGPREGE